MKLSSRWIAALLLCAIVAAGAFLLYVRYVEKREAVARLEGDAKQIAWFLEQYAHEHGGKLPASLGAPAGADGTGYGGSEGWLAYEALHYCILKQPGAELDRLRNDTVILELTDPKLRATIHVYPDLSTKVYR